MATSNLNNNRPIQNNKFVYFCKKIWSGITYFFYRYRFLWQRIGIALITLALTTILSFVLIRSMPGDIIESYARELAAQRNISIEEATRLAVQILNYDPNENIFVSFGRYLSGLFQGNLGTSMYIDGLTVNEVIAKTLPWTLFVATIALVISFFIGTAIGARMAWKRKGAEEVIASSLIVVTSSIPDYLIGINFSRLLSVIYGKRLAKQINEEKISPALLAKTFTEENLLLLSVFPETLPEESVPLKKSS